LYFIIVIAIAIIHFLSDYILVLLTDITLKRLSYYNF